MAQKNIGMEYPQNVSRLPIWIGLSLILSCKPLVPPKAATSTDEQALVPVTAQKTSLGLNTENDSNPKLEKTATERLKKICNDVGLSLFVGSATNEGRDTNEANKLAGEIQSQPGLSSLRGVSNEPIVERIRRFALISTEAKLDECKIIRGWLEQSYAEGLQALCISPYANQSIPKRYVDQHVVNRQVKKVVRQFNRADAEKKKTILKEALARGSATFECSLLGRI